MRSKIAIVCLLLLGSLAWSFERGQTLTSPRNGRYRLEGRLGGGDFAEVWEATNGPSDEHYAVKFFDSADHAVSVQNRIAAFKKAAQFEPQYLLTVWSDELNESPREGYDVIVSEVAQGSVYQLARREFRLSPFLQPDETIRRIRNLKQLVTNGKAGLRELHEVGWSHTDPNPKNLLRVRGIFKLGDLDGLTPIGEVSPRGAWEPSYGAIEYRGGRHEISSGPIADYFSFASAVFFAMVGESPLERFADSCCEGNVNLARRDIYRFPHTRGNFRRMIHEDLYQESRWIPRQVSRDFGWIVDFLTDALLADPKERKRALIERFPELTAILGGVSPLSLPTGSLSGSQRSPPGCSTNIIRYHRR